MIIHYHYIMRLQPSSYTAKSPLRFAVAKMLMNRGMTSVFDDNMDLRVFFKYRRIHTV